MESLYKNIQLLWEFLKVPFLELHFSYYTLMTFQMILSVMLLSMLMILFSILGLIRHMICGNNLNWLLILNQTCDTVDWGKKWLVVFNAGKTQLVLCDWSNSIGSIDVKMDGSVLEENPSFKMLGLTFSSKLDWDSYIISIAKFLTKKIVVLIRSMKFLSPELALSINPPYVHVSCHVWTGAPSSHLELLDKLQRRICRTVGPSRAASLEPLAHHRNVTSLSLLYRYYLGRCSSQLVQLVPLSFSGGRSTRYSDRLHDFSVTIPRWHSDGYVNSFFPRTNYLPVAGVEMRFFCLTGRFWCWCSHNAVHVLQLGVLVVQ